MSFTRYERYKQSGVEWLGDVPEHWNTLPLLAVGRERDERNTGLADSNLLSLSYGRIIRKDINTNEGLLPESFETYQIVHPGDIIFRLTDLQNDKRSLRTAIVEERGIITSAYLALEPFSANPQFLNYLFRAYDLRKVFYAMGSGVRQSMNYDDVKRMEMLLPPIEEQAAIVAFLDRETGKIDVLIEKQRRLIVLLKEKRQALISHAVAEGLNPSAPMKPSSIDWLGDVPEQWETLRVKHVSLFTTSGPRGWSERISDTGDIFVQSGDLDDELNVRLNDCKRVQVEESAETSRTLLTNGDTVVCITGAKTGNVAVCEGLQETAYINQHLCLVRPIGKILPRFLGLALKSRIGQTHFDLSQYGLKQGLSLEDVREAPVLVPPVSEQSEILSFVDSHLMKFNEVCRVAEYAVELLQERRSALISAAVTGKINVITQAAKPVRSIWSAGFARQVLAAETLSRCNGPRMGRIKLQKLIHLCEYHAQLDEVRGTYSRQAAGPFAPQVMEDVREGLLQQRWFEEYKDESRYAYRALEKAGGHKQYLPHWEDKQARIDQVLNLLGGELTQKCEIASTLYAAWNDLLIEGKKPTDTEIIHEASSAESWHESKEKIAAEKWRESLKWMRANGLVPVGYGTHTTHQPDLFTREGHESA